MLLALAATGTRLAGAPWPTSGTLGRMNGLPDLSPLALWAVLVLVNGFGEEVGWRGFALPHLEASHPPLRATLLLTGAWAGWHLPAFFFLEGFRSVGLAGFPVFFLFLATGALVFTWLYHRTGGSLLALALFHGGYNLATATEAARGPIAAVVTTAVSAWGFVLAAREVRAARRGEPSVLMEEASPDSSTAAASGARTPLAR